MLSNHRIWSQFLVLFSMARRLESQWKIYHCVQRMPLAAGQVMGRWRRRGESGKKNWIWVSMDHGLDSMYCSMVFLGNVNLPPAVVVLMSGSQTSSAFIWSCSIPPQLNSAYLGSKHSRITPNLDFCLVPSSVLAEGRNLLGFLFLWTSYKLWDSSLGVNCLLSQVKTLQQLSEHPSNFAG